MNRWLFATNNQHKIEEAQSILQGFSEVISPRDIGIDIDVDETADTFQGNALLKALAFHQASGLPCFADDSGLCVHVLNGAPGIHSARYAQIQGQPVNHQANNQKLLQELNESTDRSAYFITVICAVGFTSEPVFFEGRVYGSIDIESKGNKGFGYDPLFIPEGFDKTFAELGESIKNSLSHRSRALAEMKVFLQNLTQTNLLH
jgi:XTP/dITP diphosphohydrolase